MHRGFSGVLFSKIIWLMPLFHFIGEEKKANLLNNENHIPSFQLVITKSGILSSENAMLPTKLFGRPSCYLQFLNWFQVF